MDRVTEGDRCGSVSEVQLQTMGKTQKAVSSPIHQQADSSRKVETNGSGYVTEGSIRTNPFQNNHQILDRRKTPKSGEASYGRVTMGTSQYWGKSMAMSWKIGHANFQGEQLWQQLSLQFQPNQEGNLQEKFLAVEQEVLVAEVRRLFETLVAPLKEISDERLETTLVNGPSLEISAKVYLLGPKELDQIMNVAHKVKDMNWVIKNSMDPTAQKKFKIHLTPIKHDPFLLKTKTGGERAAYTRRKSSIKCITEKEAEGGKEGQPFELLSKAKMPRLQGKRLYHKWREKIILVSRSEFPTTIQRLLWMSFNRR